MNVAAWHSCISSSLLWRIPSRMRATLHVRHCLQSTHNSMLVFAYKAQQPIHTFPPNPYKLDTGAFLNAMGLPKAAYQWNKISMGVKSRIKFFMSPWRPVFYYFSQYFGSKDERKVTTS